MWVEIPSADGFNLLIRTYYFPPASDAALFIDHFNFLENNIDTAKYRVNIYGDFNLPKVDWLSGIINCESSWTRLKELVYSAI